MILALVIAGSMLLGAALAEAWWRNIRRQSKREALTAEFLDKQLWQFISLDEWLEGNKQKAKPKERPS